MTNYRITPRATWGSYWRWFAVRSQSWAGDTAHFLIAKSGIDIEPVSGEHFAMWSTSPDTDTWYDFDNVTLGAVDYEFYNNSAFPAGTIYVSQLPMYPFSRVQRKMAEWAAADARIVDTASTNGFIIDTMTARDNGDGRTAPALPMYGFKMTNASGYTKNNMILSAYNHPSETHGAYCLEGAMSWLLGGSEEAELLLDWFNVYVYPCLNPQGVWGGYFRSCPEDSTKDHNRQWHESVLEDITAYRAAMAADTGGTIDVGLDYHHSFGNDTYYGDVYDTSDATAVAYAAELAALSTGYDHRTSSTTGVLQVLWNSSYSAKLAVTLEQANSKSIGIAEWKAFGQNSLIAIYQMLVDGYWTNGPE